MTEHSKEAVEAYPDAWIGGGNGEPIAQAGVRIKRTAFDRGFAAGKSAGSADVLKEVEKVRSVILKYMPGADSEPDSRGIVDALFASGIIRQSIPIPTETGSTVGGDGDE